MLYISETKAALYLKTAHDARNAAEKYSGSIRIEKKHSPAKIYIELKKTQSCKNLYRTDTIMYARTNNRGYCHAIAIQLAE